MRICEDYKIDGADWEKLNEFYNWSSNLFRNKKQNRIITWWIDKIYDTDYVIEIIKKYILV